MRRITEEASLYDDLEQKPVPELLRDINREDHRVADAVEQALPQITRLTEAIVERMRQGGRLFYIGAGTSGRLGVLDASELPPTYGTDPRLVVGLIAGGDTALRHAVEHAEDDERQGWNDLVGQGIARGDTVIGIAASGTTPYVVGALRKARRHGVVTGCITSNPGTPLEAESDYPVVTIVGPEFVTGSSRMKSGTAQKPPRLRRCQERADAEIAGCHHAGTGSSGVGDRARNVCRKALSDIVFGHKIVVECLKLSEREVLYTVLNGADELVAAAVAVG